VSTEAFIYDAIRTPRGRGKSTGALHGTKPVTLVVGLIDELRKRNPQLDVDRVSDLVLGVVSPIGDQGSDIARTAVLVAGLPDTVGGVQLNRFCGSGLEAVNIAAQKVRSGWDEIVIGGGVESMSRVPMGSDGGAWAMDPETAYDTSFVPQGISADLIATLEGFSREDVDTLALLSQERCAKAMSEGRFERSVVPIRHLDGSIALDVDEFPRPGTTLEALGRLTPSFLDLGTAVYDGYDRSFDDMCRQVYPQVGAIDHVHHAGNSSGVVDGASAILLAAGELASAHGLEARARIVMTAVVGAEPVIMLTAPGAAVELCLRKAGMSISDIDLWEINEAFAAVPLKTMRDLALDPERVNVNGGAIALGHPIGATGPMLIQTALDELERTDRTTALITMCTGGGMATATIIERV
jgi:acetyl-CoA C-acetyltransferase